MRNTKCILGIDPGSISMGYGLLTIQTNKATFIECGVIRPKTKVLANKLGTIFQSVSELIAEFHPDEMAIEKVFMSKNPDSALKLGQARGAAIVAAAVANIPVFEYSANEIKKSVVGHGHATKEQVQMMITTLLNLTDQPQNDAADGLACALCHGNTQSVLELMQ